ncbi:MAG: molybdopterin-dependent oxidoreductase [Chloroflexota bacterium]
MKGPVGIVNTACAHDCGGRCVLRAHVKNGRVVRYETDIGTEPQLRACLRGRIYRQRLYSPDRLRYPMKRTGNRGEGKFQRVSWDEALDIVASELLRVKKTWGNASIVCLTGGGSRSVLHNGASVQRLLSKFGGYTRPWGTPSFEGALFASMATYGTMTTGSAREDLLNSRMIIMWGWNPAATIWDTSTPLWLIKAREKGIRIVSVDPRLTNSIAVYADEWVPIRPGTDAAMLIAMAYVMIKDGLYNKRFLDTYTVGFEDFHRYVVGEEDGIPKTPEWASDITRVPATTIDRLAHEYATNRPGALIPGWGPARGAMGEQFTRSAAALAAMTGNIGIKGGYAGGFMRAFHSREMGKKSPGNLVENNSAIRQYSLYRLRGAAKPTAARFCRAKLWDAILRGKAGGYPCDPRLLYVVSTNPLSSHPDTNKGIEALKCLEFIVVHEQRLTPTAKFADIVLPTNTFMEREDAVPPWLGSPYYLYLNKAVEPLYESKSDHDICVMLAPRLGMADYDENKDDEVLLREIAARTGDLPDFDRFKNDGVVKLDVAEPFISFTKQIADPVHNPFPTLSGKIELYSEHLAEWRNPLLPPIPKYIPPPEGYDDPLASKYPLQLITTHHPARTHSTLEGIPWLEEVSPRYVWINSADAGNRNIADGDQVMVFNDRGKVMVCAKVTERIMPGVLDLPQGAWSNLDKDGVDHGGCANVLVPDNHSPGGAWAANTVLVELRKTQ